MRYPWDHPVRRQPTLDDMTSNIGGVRVADPSRSVSRYSLPPVPLFDPAGGDDLFLRPDLPSARPARTAERKCASQGTRKAGKLRS